MKPIIRCITLFACLLALCFSVSAADARTLYNTEYCFSQADFYSDDLNDLSGIFVTAVPEDAVAVVALGSRVLRAGDILPAEALDRMRLRPTCTESCDAVLQYQPICGAALGEPACLTVRIQSGKNETPKAIGAEFETYKNIPNDGTLCGSDPENASLSFRLAEKPKRGTVKLESDGTYVYTPDKNRVGEDSFSFTVTDEAGNVSEPAEVKIRILKPSEAMAFSDLPEGNDRFEAMWLCESGLNSGRSIAGNLCFCPEDTVSRSEFLVMAMELMEVPVDEALTISGFTDAQEAAAWVQPYLAAAMQRGLISGEVTEAGLLFRPNEAITGQEAAVMLQNLVRLPVSVAAINTEADAWAAASLQALQEAGITLSVPEEPLTRLEAARLLWEIRQLD